MEERLLDSETTTTSQNLKGRVLEELRKIWKVAFPAMLSRVTGYGMLIVTQAFIGHVGAVELAGYALAQVISLRFANGIFGIWIGMLLGVVTQTLVLGYITIRIDWDEQVNKATERLNKWYLKPTEESNGSSSQRESE